MIKMKYFVSYFILLLAMASFIQSTAVSHRLENLFVKVKLNESITLDCTEFLRANKTQSSNSEVKSNETISNKSLDNLIFMFKKNKLVIKMHSPVLKVNFVNMSDQGVYECGYFEIDKYGIINYSTQKVWDIRIYCKKSSSNPTHTQIKHYSYFKSKRLSQSPWRVCLLLVVAILSLSIYLQVSFKIERN